MYPRHILRLTSTCYFPKYWFNIAHPHSGYKHSHMNILKLETQYMLKKWWINSSVQLWFLNPLKDFVKGFARCSSSTIRMFPFLGWNRINVHGLFRFIQWWLLGVVGGASRTSPIKISSIPQQLHRHIRIQQPIFPHRDHFLCNLGDDQDYGLTSMYWCSLLCSKNGSNMCDVWTLVGSKSICIALIQQLGIYQKHRTEILS